MTNVLLVGIGGFLGSAARYLITGLVTQASAAARFPLGTLAVNIALYKSLPYDSQKDLEPIGLGGTNPMVLVTKKDLPAKDFKEFQAYVTANQKKVQYGMAGIGAASHLGGLMLNSMMKVDVLEIPYKGTGPALNDLVYPAVTEVIGPANADRFTRIVFWGLGAPGVQYTRGNVSLETARALMALYRTDSVTTPVAIDGGYLPRLQKLPTTFTATSVSSSSGTEVIRAAQVAVYADTININGDLIVGDTNSPNRSVVIPEMLQGELSDYQTAWQNGQRANPLYRIKADQLQVKATGDVLLGVTFDARTGELLGAHMIGAEVTEMIQGYTIARTLESTEAELMHTVFPHPTLSEMMHESVLDAYGRAIKHESVLDAYGRAIHF